MALMIIAYRGQKKKTRTDSSSEAS
jgi:hypothetical protein